MKIEEREITDNNLMDLVTYVPLHAKGNAGHKDCEPGVLMDYHPICNLVSVLYSKGRRVQRTDPDDLVWG